jgi:hypothetical protein
MKHLFIDLEDIEATPEERKKLQIKVNKPQKLGKASAHKLPAISGEFIGGAYGSIIQEEKMTYMFRSNTDKTLLYTSVDGLNWVYTDEIEKNICGEGTVYKSKTGRLHSVYFTEYEENAGVRAYFYDGANWFPYADFHLKRMCDSQNIIFWDEKIKKYVCYLRGWTYPHRFTKPTYTTLTRAVQRYEFSTLTELNQYNQVGDLFFDPEKKKPPKVIDPEHTVLCAEEGKDPLETDIYTPAVHQYEDYYFAFPSIYRHIAFGPDDDWLNHPNEGIVEIQLAASRDGKEFKRFHEPYIPLGAAHIHDDCGTMYMNQGMYFDQDRIYQFYVGSPMTHDIKNIWTNYKVNIGFVCVTEQLKDRFTYLWSDDVVDFEIDRGYRFKKQQIRPVTFKNIIFNVDSSATGSFIYCLVGYEDQQLTRWTPIHGNQLKYEVNLAGNAIKKIKIRMKQAKLFAVEYIT